MAFTFRQFAKNPSMGNLFRAMGDNPNSAILIAIFIALFKGIFRPMFTLMDKKSDSKTKKYAALREGLTELIAIPIYFAVPHLGKKLIVDTFYNTASNVTKKAVETNVKFIAVLASTAIIPAICNIAQPPIMAFFQKNSDAKNAKLTKNIPIATNISKPSFSGKLPIGKVNYGMRIGN